MNQHVRQMADSLSDLFNHHMPFNQLLGLRVAHLDDLQVEIQLDWHDKLMGNPQHKILHGGVTAAILDTAGSLAALLEGARSLNSADEAAAFFKRLANGGTLDMRVDYLRPGRGAHFIAHAQVLRRGKTVSVCRMDLYNESGLHIATATGTYIQSP